MNRIRFWKTESVGNHFVLVDSRDLRDADLPRAAIELCAHRFGVGADGLLAVEPLERGLSLRMFNPDGTEDFCGNGLRCAGWHGQLEHWVGASFEILHGGRWVPCEIQDGRVSVTLPPASFDAASVPTTLPAGQALIAGLTGIPVSTGSPHFVAILPELPDDDTFVRVSRAIETAPEFPESISVMWTKALSPRRLALRIWERGVGETFGCGTGSVAAAAVWARLAALTGEIQVDNPGGPVAVDLLDGEVVSSTSPTRVFSGEVSLSSRSLLSTAAWPPTSLH